MEERKKYEFLVFLTIYVIFIFLMLPVGVKAPIIIERILAHRYGEMIRTTEPGVGAGAEERSPSPYRTPAALAVAAGLIILGAVGGGFAYQRFTRRDYRVTRQGRAECSGKLAERPNCRCYRPTPSTECVYFLGTGDEGMCVRKAEKRAKEKRGKPVRTKSR
jgi:hypothetical protein